MTTYYVDEIGGNDSNPGTREAPMQTIQHAHDVSQQYDVIRSKSGRIVNSAKLTKTNLSFIGRWDDGPDLFTYSNTASGFATSPTMITNCIVYKGVNDKTPGLLKRIKNTLSRVMGHPSLKP